MGPWWFRRKDDWLLKEHLGIQLTYILYVSANAIYNSCGAESCLQDTKDMYFVRALMPCGGSHWYIWIEEYTIVLMAIWLVYAVRI